MSNQNYLTLKQAAGMLGLPYFKVQRAAKRGEIPSYQFHNSRKLVLLDEIQAIIRQSNTQGKFHDGRSSRA